MILELTDTALIMRRLFISENKLEGRKVGNRNVSVNFLVPFFLLLHKKRKEVFYLFVELM